MEQFIRIEFKESSKRWISSVFEDSYKYHIPKWFNPNKHIGYIINLERKKSKVFNKNYRLNLGVKLLKRKLMKK